MSVNDLKPGDVVVLMSEPRRVLTLGDPIQECPNSARVFSRNPKTGKIEETIVDKSALKLYQK